jgi:hypothetical protein
VEALLEVVDEVVDFAGVDFAVIAVGVAAGVVLAEVLVEAAGVEAVVELVVAGVLEPVVDEVPVVPADLLDLDFFFLLVVEVVDGVEELEELLGVCDVDCDFSSFEKTTPISSASNTGGITFLRRIGKFILSISLAHVLRKQYSCGIDI